jgi:hypothetical protein
MLSNLHSFNKSTQASELQNYYGLAPPSLWNESQNSTNLGKIRKLPLFEDMYYYEITPVPSNQ